SVDIDQLRALHRDYVIGLQEYILCGVHVLSQTAHADFDCADLFLQIINSVGQRDRTVFGSPRDFNVAARVGLKSAQGCEHFHQRAPSLQRVNSGTLKSSHEEDRLAAKLNYRDDYLRLANIFAKSTGYVRLLLLHP